MIVPRALKKALIWIVTVLAVTSGLALVAMVGVICTDVLFRAFGGSIAGTIDIIKILAAVTISAAMPYTVATNGHVAIEYFCDKLPHLGTIFIESLMRSIASVVFILLAWRFIMYGSKFLSTGQVSNTIQLPIFWLPWLIAICCLATAIVSIYQLLTLGKDLYKA